ncbi:MAG: hypothetical protein GEU82_14995 [Luteitalea sp.]|nr:hypothetical protein [Luteitalea sp.]
MLHPAEARVRAAHRTADAGRRQLEALGRPHGALDARRYFRAADDLEFYNVGMPTVRRLARQIAQEHRGSWSVGEAMAFAERLVCDPHLEAKLLGIEVLACYRRAFTRRMLTSWKGWLSANHASNWATTDAMCGALIGPLLLSEPSLANRMPAWARHRNMWVRRAAAVSLVPLVRKGYQLSVGYTVARLLHGDTEDLIQKAVGWMLREAGKTDIARLEQYLRTHGPGIPRTTLRYAIERFPPPARRHLLSATRRKA